MTRPVRIGIDVGGTFTDVFLFDELRNVTVRHKLPSTPENPYEAPIQGIREILSKAGVSPQSVGFVGLGTTVATNALIERKGAATGLITTEGFRDLLEIGRQKRPHAFDMFRQRPPPLVGRDRRLEVSERMGYDGTIIRPLDLVQLERAVRGLVAEGVAAIAICFLNAYVNPEHERVAAAKVRALWPEGFVSVSHELLPEFREYERLSSTVINAYLMPRMQSYLARFRDEVLALGIPDEPFVMGSGGGVLTPGLAGERPLDTLSSGPSGGVSGAVHLARAIERPDMITFDMGGTSTDVCLIRGGRAEVTHSRVVDGMPIKSTAVDVHSVGAGGSSIAWVDPGGLLRVGPHSAGANPGPACYGRGGMEPTVTDANVVLGRLNPEYLLAGALAIDPARAFAAIEQHVAVPKGLSVQDAAAAIVAVSETSISQAIRFVSVERGQDPRQFALVAFGGAGPLHAAEVARELGMQAIIPESPGVLCAMGVLTKDVEIDLSQTCILRELSEEVARQVEAIYRSLAQRAQETLQRSGLALDRFAVERVVEARYAGQNFELPVAASGDPIGTAELEAIRAGFHAAHRRLYGYDQPGKEIELVTFRLKAVLPARKYTLQARPAAQRTGPLTASGNRRVFFASGVANCPIYAREKLLPGDRLDGPAIIEQMDTTIAIPPDFRGRVDEFHNLHLALRA